MLQLLAFELIENRWMLPALFVVAWYIQMGLHEGGHAYMATWLGDPVPRAFGRLTFNPLRHIEWNDMGYVFGAVLLPIATAFSGWIPMGMAYVPVSRGTTAHDMKVALAGPIGSFAGAVIGIVFAFLVWPLIQMGTFGNFFGSVLFFFPMALVLTSVLYGAFNLLPIPPLDGSSVAYHYMNQNGRDLMNRIRPYGFLIIIAVFWILPYISGGKLDASSLIFRPIMEIGGEATYWLPLKVYGPIQG
jgi:Zn-dependent protease